MLTHLLRGGNSKLLYDNVEQEKPEFTYFDAFIPNLRRSYTLDIRLMLRFANTSFKGLTGYEL